MRIRVLAVRRDGEVVNINVETAERGAASGVMLPAWVVEHLGIVAGDVVSICREYEGEPTRKVLLGWRR